MAASRDKRSRDKTNPPPPRLIEVEVDEVETNEADVESGAEIGLSLTELSETYAALLGQGDDPYQPAPEATDELGRSIAETADEPTSELHEPTAGSYRSEEPQEITPRAILEAMLFVGHPENQALESSLVASLMRGVSTQEVDELIEELNAEYAAAGAPYIIESFGAGYRMVLREPFGPLADRFLGRVREAKLTQGAVDVLAVVAYNQPITRDEVDRLRGRASGAILAQLIRRDLLKLERRDGERRQIYYSTTPRFLELFGLETLDDLPRSQDLDR